MRTLKSIALAATAIFAIAACKKDDPNPGKQENTNQNDIEFKVSASNPTEDGITISVSHNGSDKETYYGFYYSDLETSVTNAINRIVAGFTEAGTDLSTVVSTGKTNISVIKDLEQNTSYRYVVFGLNTDGTTYGTPGSCEFTTEKGEVVFGVKVEASGITETSAVATVTSTGTASDTWYCFYTTDLTSSLETVISDKVQELGSNLSSELKSGNTSVTFSGLTKATRYRAVVTGLKSDGTTYGKAAEATFKTAAGDVEYTVNPAWTVTYAGKGTYQGEILDMIDVTATSDDRYIPALVTVSEFEQMGIKAFTEYMIADYQALIDEYVNAGYPIGWEDVSYTGTETGLGFNALSGGEWYGFALGVDTDGNPTGLYAQSEAFTPEEIEASEAYNKWLGTWKITGSNNVENTVTISANSPDVLYSISGYQFGIGEGPDISASFNTETGTLSFISEEFGQIDTGQYGTATLGIFGSITYNGEQSSVTGGNYLIGEATLSGDNAATAEGLDIELNIGTYPITGMEFVAVLSGQYEGYILTYNPEAPMFPFSMEKVESSSTALAKIQTPVVSLKTMSPLKMMTSSFRAIIR